MVKEIPLTKEHVALVDDDDYVFLIQWDWYAKISSGNKLYAARSVNNKLKKGVITMHSVILPAPDGMEPDHINGNGLDNRRRNLRPATHQQNMWNRKPVSGSSSLFKGVSWHGPGQYWKAYIKINDKQQHLGCFWSEEDAARAYNKAARELHGEFAKLNFVEDGPCQSMIAR